LKKLTRDRLTNQLFEVSAYEAAQATEMGELANPDRPSVQKTGEVEQRLSTGKVSLSQSYQLVKRARGGSARALLAVEIDRRLLEELKAFAKRHNQSFRDTIEHALSVWLMEARDS
jgi:hypothetical protein